MRKNLRDLSKVAKLANFSNLKGRYKSITLSLSGMAMLIAQARQQGQAVHELVGRSFRFDNGDYQIVAVRNLEGQIIVYAESDQIRQANYAPGPRRTAFHYTDIAPFLPNEVAAKPDKPRFQ